MFLNSNPTSKTLKPVITLPTNATPIRKVVIIKRAGGSSEQFDSKRFDGAIATQDENHQL